MKIKVNDMGSLNITPFIVSLKLALTTTFMLFVIAFPVACMFAFYRFRCKFILEQILTLPIIMPPTVLGFYILMAFSPDSILGNIITGYMGVDVLFTFKGIVVASCIATFPFMLLPLKNGLLSVDKSLIEASYTLGKTKFETMLKVIIPCIIPYIISGPVTTFAHTIGGFGVVLMTGGNIPGVTKVASIEIYELVEGMNYGAAHIYSIILLAISVAVISMLNWLNKSEAKKII